MLVIRQNTAEVASNHLKPLNKFTTHQRKNLIKIFNHIIRKISHEYALKCKSETSPAKLCDDNIFYSVTLPRQQ